mmetsp:Transcript_9355/g.18469  ORF Transcript_9355/g.18469 Transcript_9355/m.18469 type:complete len:619 (-) Transcript_9355:149-2005(-)|eukprot:CAMPEP_0171501088 /NCGR_PEP_ID=MMETSP0958-20121227/9364_1 /TAXON_ID=87120 /ORGANISM="Aurantiochytrium limacinum, Strain ATCCMYA-1381" /LENGTH=618 /DNA_ID=CAMNT_0012035865 /DNA_START=344 /DNA_END=2200 /DNA_ORIENTATION=-
MTLRPSPKHGSSPSWLAQMRSKIPKQVFFVVAFWGVLLLTQYAQYTKLEQDITLDNEEFSGEPTKRKSRFNSGSDLSLSSDSDSDTGLDGDSSDDDSDNEGDDIISIDPEDRTVDYSDVFAAALAASRNGEESTEWDSVHKLISTKPLMFRARLPRSTTRPYNNIPDGMKAFSYSPSGGYNNQLRCLIAAIVLCKMSDRALLVPMAGPHTNFARNYLKNTLNSLVPMDQLVDFEYLEKMTGVPLIPLNMTLTDYRKKRVGGLRVGGRTPRAWIFQIGTPLSWIEERGVREHENRIKNYNGRILIYIGPFYTRHWQEDWVINAIRYTAYLRGLSKHISNEALDGGRYNAVHLRLGDYIKAALSKSKDSRNFVRRGQDAGFKQSEVVYVATDQPSHRADGSLNNYFRPFGHFKRLIFARDLASHPGTAAALLDFKNRLPNNKKVVSDMFGLVEQLICARAQNFVGTSVSTFSKTINVQRSNLLTTIPEIETGLIEGGHTLLIRWSGYIDEQSTVSFLEGGSKNAKTFENTAADEEDADDAAARMQVDENSADVGLDADALEDDDSSAMSDGDSEAENENESDDSVNGLEDQEADQTKTSLRSTSVYDESESFDDENNNRL